MNQPSLFIQNSQMDLFRSSYPYLKEWSMSRQHMQFFLTNCQLKIFLSYAFFILDLYNLSNIQIIEAIAIYKMDLNEPNQETQSIVNQNLSRLERYFAYYKQQSKANELQCIPQTNQFIQKIEKESQRSKIQLTYKKADAVIDLLKQQLSILAIHREHEAAISQYKWHLSERFQLNWKYEQTVCQKIREEKKKEKIKTNKSNKKNPIKMKKYVYVLNKQQQQFQKAKRPFSEIDEKWMTSIKEEQSQDQRQTQQIEKNPEDY